MTYESKEVMEVAVWLHQEDLGGVSCFLDYGTKGESLCG